MRYYIDTMRFQRDVLLNCVDIKICYSLMDITKFLNRWLDKYPSRRLVNVIKTACGLTNRLSDRVSKRVSYWDEYEKTQKGAS